MYLAVRHHLLNCNVLPENHTWMFSRRLPWGSNPDSCMDVRSGPESTLNCGPGRFMPRVQKMTVAPTNHREIPMIFHASYNAKFVC